MAKLKQVDPETRKAMEEAVLAFGSLSSRELNWLIEMATGAVAEAIEKQEMLIIRCEAPQFSDEPFIRGGVGASLSEDRKERALKFRENLKAYRKLHGVAQKLSKAARALATEEFGEAMRAFFGKKP